MCKDSVNLAAAAEYEESQRLDNCLIKIPEGVSKSHIHRIIRADEVRLNKKRYKPDNRIQAGDTVRIPLIRTAERQRSSESQAAPAHESDIVYEDDAFLVINKPSGAAVHGGNGMNFGVIEQIRRARPGACYLELIHRLDKDTSGLLMTAEECNALVKLYEAIRNDYPRKIYLALGVGRLPNDHFHVKFPLSRYTGVQDERMVRISEGGRSAHIIFRVLNCLSDSPLYQVGLFNLTSVEATLKTGRIHQAHVHLQSQDRPIANDERYGDYQADKHLRKLGLKRMFLRAFKLHLARPLTGEKLTLKAPLPQELAQLILMLENQEKII